MKRASQWIAVLIVATMCFCYGYGVVHHDKVIMDSVVSLLPPAAIFLLVLFFFGGL